MSDYREQLNMALATTKQQSAQPRTFADRAKVALLLRGMTVVDLAKALGLARNTVSQAIHHKIGMPTRRKIASFLMIDM